MKIIAYTFEGDVHCPACTRKEVVARRWRQDHSHPFAIGRVVANALDDNSVPLDLVDREGNLIRPVFDIDEDPDGTFTHCGDCREELT